MEVLEAIERRTSVRSYDETPVAEEKIEALLKMCYSAPSAGDLHPYKVVVVMERARKAALASACHGQDFVAEAPVALVFFVDLRAAGQGYGRRGIELYSLLDVGAAIESMMLAAVDAGLGTCWVGAFDDQEVHELLDAPPDWRAVSVVSLGRASGSVRRRPPPPLEGKAYLDSCRNAW